MWPRRVWFRRCFISCFMMFECSMWYWNDSAIRTLLRCQRRMGVTIFQALNVSQRFLQINKEKHSSDVTIAVFLPSRTSWSWDGMLWSAFPLSKMGLFPKRLIPSSPPFGNLPNSTICLPGHVCERLKTIKLQCCSCDYHPFHSAFTNVNPGAPRTPSLFTCTLMR